MAKPSENGSREHNSEEFFLKLLADAILRRDTENDNHDNAIEEDQDLHDCWQEEYKKHLQSISSILGDFRTSYSNKVRFQGTYRKILFWGCAAIVITFTLAILCVLKHALNASRLDISDAVAIITAIVSLVVSILELVQIITRYCFPENDDKYIIKIVESIQENDLGSLKALNQGLSDDKIKSTPSEKDT